jgi:glycosyltransferase involved in cell wall biosynthesis
MKVLMISGDKNVFVEGSDAAKRLALQRAQVEKLDVFGYRGRMSAVQGFFEVMIAALCTRYDVVTVQEPFWRGLLGLMAARVSGARLNIQVHTDFSTYSGFRHILAQIVLRHADSFRVVSQKIGEQIKKYAHGQIHILPIYIDLERFRQVMREQHEQKTILWIGRFEREKDPLAAIEILKNVRHDIPDARLVMLGSGSLLPKLERASQGLPVLFAGWHEPLEYLKTADVVVSTSKHESFGASIVEALAAGVPVVAPDVGIAKEAGAIVVERSKLAEAVIEVLQNATRGILKISMPTKEEWAKAWKESLI